MPEPKPARTCIGVAELPAGGTDVEIEFVAYDGQDVTAYYTGIWKKKLSRKMLSATATMINTSC